MNPSAERPAPIESPPAPHSHLVVRQDELASLMAAVRAHESVALDTEADSLHHYHEKVCLIQLTVNDEHWIVDPLSDGLDLKPLMRLLETRSLILHGADYDLRLLHRAYAFRPRRLLDTMLAAQLLGWNEFGLASLVERICGVSLSKHGQRADWSVRPLPGSLLVYAVDDTRYLHRLAQSLLRDLEALDRLEWLVESCERLLEATRKKKADSDRDEAWRIKGGRHLTGRAAALLRELWRWRESIARRIDRPPFRIAANAFLLEWCHWLVETPDATAAQMPPRPPWLRSHRLQSFELAVQRALAMTPDEWPRPPAKGPSGQRLLPEEEELLKGLLLARDGVAERLAIHAGVLGPREALKPLVRRHPTDEQSLRESSGLMRWQAQCLAPVLLPRFTPSA